jgi:ribosomal protein S17E
MDKPTYELRPLLAEVRDGYREMRTLRTSLRTAKREVIRTARAERKTLKRDLAGYTTPGDRADLEAILERYSDEETADIRKLLAGRR